MPSPRPDPEPSRTAPRLAAALAILAGAFGGGDAVRAQVSNLRVVTDGSPDYHDLDGMMRSITSGWETPAEKCWALFYWNHRARRQTATMYVHGLESNDPIRQYNDYGHMLCSTVAGLNDTLWDRLGYPTRFWDITAHTVSECFYEGRWHLYDNSMSAIYTLCDGVTVAAVEDIGKEGACAASGGKREAGHIARYHCLTATSPNGFLTGADCLRDLAQEHACFNPNALKYRWYYKNWDRGHRYILNLRDGQAYTRFYRRLDADSPGAVPAGSEKGYRADPAYYVPNEGEDGKGSFDTEALNPRYRLRGNGRWAYAVPLDEDVRRHALSMAGLGIMAPAGLEPLAAGVPGEAVFEVETANVLTSLVIAADFERKGAADTNAVLVSTTNGRTWQEVWKNEGTGAAPARIVILEPVRGSYAAIVKVRLLGASAAGDARLKSLRFDAITQVNAKTLPALKLGRNTVHVGAGPQSESIVLWPDLRGDRYEPCVVDEKGIVTAPEHPGYTGVLWKATKEDGYVVFRMDAPRDIVGLNYGARVCNRHPDCRVDLLHSFDGGRSWIRSYSFTGHEKPCDFIHFERVQEVPPGTRSVLFKYLLSGGVADPTFGLYAVRMEADHEPLSPGFRPLEVTFAWDEVQEDYGKIRRSHTGLIEALPCRYEIDVGGADHPAMESLRVNLRGALGTAAPGGEADAGGRYGYRDGDGRDVAGPSGAAKFRERWVTFGKVLSEGKPYISSVPSETGWDAGDPELKVLTDGVVGSPYAGGTAYRWGALWTKEGPVDITVDLGEKMACGAFRIQISGYPFFDAGKGEFPDDVEVLASVDGERYAGAGKFDFRIRRKDLPANHFWNQDETFTGHNFELIPPAPVEARYVRFHLNIKRITSVSEVQVLDGIRYEPFDLKLALPPIPGR